MYGPSGAGKTTLAGTFNVLGPVLFLDWDNKMKGLYGQHNIFVKSYAIKEPKDALSKFTAFKKDWKDLRNGKVLAPDGSPFRAVVIDSWTRLDTIAVTAMCQLAGKDPDVDKATLPVYGDLISWYEMFQAQLQGFKDMWVVVICHDHLKENEEGGVKRIQPLITGRKFLDKFPTVFEEIWYLEKDRKGIPILSFTAKDKTICTTTTLEGTDPIKDPTFRSIMERIK